MKSSFRRRLVLPLIVVALVLVACGQAGEEVATGEPVKVGMFYDGSGLTSSIGVPARQGFEDYMNLVNKKGGIDGHPVSVTFIDMAYEVPKGVEGYERMKREGVVAIGMWATPLVSALQERAAQDRIPLLHTGFGVGAAILGERFPYNFPMGGSYWSQAAGVIRFILDQWKEQRPPRIAFTYLDNPAGREPLELMNELARREGFELRTYAIPLPGLDVTAQVTDIVQRFRADWVIGHVFGRPTAVHAKAFKDAGFPMNRLVHLWGGSYPEDFTGIGGFAAVEGMYITEIFEWGPETSVAKEIARMYQEEGRTPSEYLSNTRSYYLGLVLAAHIVEGARIALKEFGWPLDGTKVKQGLERVRGEVAGIIKVNMSPEDHDGGGFVRIQQIGPGGKVEPKTDWLAPYRDIIIEVARRAQ